uniref:DRBM domain-containing protein n=1 Tax=Panagrolaimus sp. ES5 TaxID=591445 RepID=A0AC34GTJ3_9BILA
MDVPQDELTRKRNFDDFMLSSPPPPPTTCPFSHLIKKPKIELMDPPTSNGFADVLSSSNNEGLNPQMVTNDNDLLDIDTSMTDNLEKIEANADESSPDAAAAEIFDDENDGEDFDDIDDYLEADMDEIHQKEKGEYVNCEKTVLKRRPKDLFTILPDNWVEATHDSGLVVYLHKTTRVCTFSRPYYIGPGSVRHHRVPPSAIPCYYQKKLAEEEESNAKAQQRHIERLARECDTNKDLAVMNEINAPLIKIKESKDVAAEDLSAQVLHEYASKAFEFKKITYRRYKEWKKARKHFKDVKKLNSDKANLLKNIERPMLPSDTKLITVPSLETNNKPSSREFCLNPRGKTALTILHEYVQKVLKSSVEYDPFEVKDPINPYHAIAKIKITSTSNAIISMSTFRERLSVIQEEYKMRVEQDGNKKQVEEMKDVTVIGRGSGKSKKAAKIDAAKSAVKLLIPEIEFDKDGVALQNVNEEKELELFDMLEIEDSRISVYSHRSGQPQPFVILQDCLSKSAPLANCEISTATQKAGHSKIEYRLKVGDKHEVVVIAVSANEGKQLAAQKMLKKIYPQFTKYGSILRLYGSQIKQANKDLKKEQKEFQNRNSAVKTSSTSRSSKRVDKNPEFVNAVREHMIKYAARAKPRNLDLIYSTTPLLPHEIEELRLKSQQHSAQNGDKLLEKIPKL